MKKKIIKIGKLFNLCAHSWQEFVEDTLQIVTFTMFSDSSSLGKDSVAFIPFFVFSKQPKTKTKFPASWWLGNK